MLKGLIHLTSLNMHTSYICLFHPKSIFKTLQLTNSQKYYTKAMIVTKCETHIKSKSGDIQLFVLKFFSVTEFNRFTDSHCLKYTNQAVVARPLFDKYRLRQTLDRNISFVKFLFCLICDYASVSVPLNKTDKRLCFVKIIKYI